MELNQHERDISAGLLWLLKGDATQRLMAAWSMGWPPAQQASGVNWQPPFLAILLSDPYSAVRDVAHRSLTTLPGFGDVEFIYLGGTDHYRETAAAVTERWRQQDSAAANAELLLDSDSGVDAARVDELLRQRDDRPIEISE